MEANFEKIRKKSKKLNEKNNLLSDRIKLLEAEAKYLLWKKEELQKDLNGTSLSEGGPKKVAEWLLQHTNK